MEGKKQRSECAMQSAEDRHGVNALGFVVERHLSTNRTIVADREGVVIYLETSWLIHTRKEMNNTKPTVIQREHGIDA